MVQVSRGFHNGSPESRPAAVHTTIAQQDLMVDVDVCQKVEHVVSDVSYDRQRAARLNELDPEARLAICP